MSWLHAICVVLASVDEWKDLIYNRVNEPDDLQPLVDISDRVSATMKHLISSDTFNSQQMSKVLAFLTFKMENVARTFELNTHSLRYFWEDAKPFLSGGSLVQMELSALVKSSSRPMPKGSLTFLRTHLLKSRPLVTWLLNKAPCKRALQSRRKEPRKSFMRLPKTRKRSEM